MRTKKTKLNIITAILYQLVATAYAFIIPRLILVSYGSTYNGVFQSVTQLMAAVSFLTVGVSGSTRVALYKSLADNDMEKTSGIVNANRIYMRKVGIVLCIYTLILAFVYPFISHNSLNNGEVMLLVLIISMSSISEYFFGITYRTLLSADQREYVYSITMFVIRVLNAALIFILIKAGANIFLVYFLQSLLYAFIPLGLSIYIKGHYKLDRKAAASEETFVHQKAAACQSIAEIVHTNTDMIVLTLFTDAKVISVYSVYNNVINKVWMITRIFTNSLEAAFGNMWAKKEFDTLRDRFRTYEFFMNSFVSVVFSCIFLLIIPFVKLYTKGVTDIEYVDYAFAYIIVFAQAVFCIREPYVTIVQAAGKYEETKKAAITEAIINIAVSVILVWKLGLIGVAIGTAAANIFRTIHYVWFTYKSMLGKSYLEEIKRLLVLALNIAASVGVCCVLGLVNIDSWLDWVTHAMIIFIISGAITLATGSVVFRDETKKILKVVLNMVPGKSAGSR